MTNLIQQVVEWARVKICNEGYSVVDVAVKGTKNSPNFKFFIDHEDGVTIKDCVILSRSISNIIDAHLEEIGLINYSLEVSSPGIDRSLKTKFDFDKNRGRDVDISFILDGREQKMNGIIYDTIMDSVLIEINNDICSVPFDSIQSAKLKLKW